ncbi:PepSY-associated TM helix domain-containing protein [Pontibacter silvestris]|uniref:PepSY-associated TM helix domain-containing protein n=1 Tax=Pontibacter silvestris TaxID=2305183 RepID=A0ABW4WVP2_9BACT|nr:PepSY-associated TM helix domain-containing protein [Pontibacter silvestris]MCC9138754.1 PepSY domain-containing protein [Pontibacter silvestris]
MKKSFTWRKLFNDIHLWLGIASGFVLFIVCLSGTIYTFRTEVEEFLEPDKYRVETTENAQVLPPDALIAKLEKELKGKVVSLDIPQDKKSTYRFGVAQQAAGGEGHSERGNREEAKGENRAETAGNHTAPEAGGKEAKGSIAQGGPQAERGGHGGGPGGSRPKTYLVDPYTGIVKGTTDSPASEFFMTMMQLHRWLLIEGGVGKMIVGIATIIFVFLLLTGLVIWFPVKLKNWKQGLKIKTNANWKRINHDLHNTLGFYSFLLLLIMSLTGLCWSFEWYRNGVSAIMGDEVFKGRREKPLPSNPPGADALHLTTVDFIQRANTLLPYAGNIKVSLPADSVSSVVVSKTKAGFFALSAPDKVQLDQYTGQPLKVEIFAEKPLNEQIVALIRPLHLGDVYGTFSKILYFIACLIATSLPVTGTLIWINKLKKKSKKARAKKSIVA